MYSLHTSKVILKESPESVLRNLICSRDSETFSLQETSQDHLLNTQLLTFREFNPRHKTHQFTKQKHQIPDSKPKKMAPHKASTIILQYLLIYA